MVYTQAEKDFMAEETKEERNARLDAARAKLTTDQQLALDENVADIVRWVTERHPHAEFDCYNAMELISAIGAWYVRKPKEATE